MKYDNSIKRILSVTSLFLITCPGISSGAASRVAFQDAIAVARGNAFTATADNASAVFYNSAGLTQLNHSEIRASAYTFATEYEYSGASGSASADDDLQVVPSFFAAHRFENMPLAIGFGAYAPFALGIDWGITAPFAPLAYDAELSYTKYHPVIAWQITETFSIGFGPSYDSADIELNTSGALGRFNGEGETIGLSFSILWQPSHTHSFGLNYQANTKMKFDGISTSLVPGLGGPAKADIAFPESIVIGYSWRPSKKWNLEINLDWTNWDRVNSLQLKSKSTVAEIEIPLGWDSAFIYEAGITRYFGSGWNLSAGYTYVENAVPDANFLPIVPDANRNFFSLGVGREHGSFSWQFVYQVSQDEKRSVNSSGGLPPDGVYDLDSQSFAFSLGYKF